MLFRLGPTFGCLLFSFFLAGTRGAQNRTIDDTLGDSVTGKLPTYHPDRGVWEDASCSTCFVKPEKAKAFKGTWTAATYHAGLGSMSVQLAFKGTAVYIFFILANTLAWTTTNTECNFTLDGQYAGSFTHMPASTTELEYNTLVYSRDGLENVDHDFTISTSGLNYSVFVNFDYAIYTFEDIPIIQQPQPPPSSLTSTSTTLTPPTSPTSQQPSSSSLLLSSTTSEISTSSVSSLASIRAPTSFESITSSGSSSPPSTLPSISDKSNPVQTGAIAGGVAGGVIGLVVILLFLVCWRRRRRRYRQEADKFSEMMPNPYQADLASGLTSPSSALSPYRDESASQSETSGFTNNSLLQPVRPANFTNHPSHIPLLTTKLSREQMMNAVGLARQVEIDRQVQTVTQGMKGLERALNTEVRQQGRNDEAEVLDLREQIQMMQEQIDYLQSQQQSPWAQGLSDEPPPGYSARTPSTRR